MSLMIPIDDADICRECSTVFNGAEHARCPGCGSNETVPVMALLPPELAAGLGEHLKPRPMEERPMNLNKAAVCLDCWEVFDGQAHDHCPVCGGRSRFPASSWIRPMCEATEKARPVDLPVAQAAQGGAHGSA